MIPHPTTVLVIGKPDEHREELVNHFIADALKKNKETLYITVDKDPRDVINGLGNLVNIDEHIKNKKIHFIDCYSAARHKEKEDDVISLIHPRDLRKVHKLTLEKLSKLEKPERVVVDTLSGLSRFNTPAMIESFIDVTIGRLKKNGATVLLLVDEDSHPTYKADLEVLTDMTLRLHEIKNKTMISLYGLVNGVLVQRQMKKDEFFEQYFNN